MHAVLFLSHLLAIAIKQKFTLELLLLYTWSGNKLFSSSKSDQSCRYTLFIIRSNFAQNLYNLPCLFVLVELLAIFFDFRLFTPSS